jgi:hypothetical protein
MGGILIVDKRITYGKEMEAKMFDTLWLIILYFLEMFFLYPDRK